MTFPTPYTVQYHAAAIVTEDELGNNSVIFNAPVDVKVQQIVPAVTEKLDGYASRAITDIDLYVPADFKPGLLDRFTLPDAGLYEVIGLADHNFGFHQWAPGSVVKLKRVTG